VTSARTTILSGLFLCALLAAGYALWPRAAVTELERQALAEGRTIITYWDRHSGHEHAARMALIDEFNRGQREVYVRGVAIGFNALMEKTLTATAGGAPPDVQSMDTGFLQQLAPQGIFLPLDDFVASVPDLHQDRFFPFCWEMVAFGGHVWGIPTTTDTYCLLWNKAAFRKAGLDPERPPRTIEELNDYAAKLTIRTADGMIEQMGFLPWAPWDQSHMWGIFFGGRWYNYETGEVNIAKDPGLIASFRWQQSFTVDPAATVQLPYAMDPERIAAFSKGMGDYFSANNPFYSGKVAMISEGEWQLTFIPKYAPNLEWGVAPLPRAEGAPPASYSLGCIVDVIPATARHPEAAKKFLRWFYSPRTDGRPSPACDYAYQIHNIPVRKQDAADPRFADNAKFRVFVDELLSKPVYGPPVMPVTQYMTDQIERMREQLVFRKITPEEALRRIETLTRRELARVRGLLARSGAGADWGVRQ